MEEEAQQKLTERHEKTYFKVSPILIATGMIVAAPVLLILLSKCF